METKPQSDLNPEEIKSTQEQNSLPTDELAENSLNSPVESAEAAVPNEEVSTLENNPPEDLIQEEPVAEADEVDAAKTEDSVVAEISTATEETAEPVDVSTLVAEVDNPAHAEEEIAEVVSEKQESEAVEEPVAEKNPDTQPGIELIREAIPTEETQTQTEPVVKSEMPEAKTEITIPVAGNEATLLPAVALTDLDSDGSEDDDTDDQEETEVDDLADLDGMTREELVSKLEELVKDSDVQKIKNDVSRIKVAFLKLNKDFKHEAYQKLVALSDNTESEGEGEGEGTETVAVAETPTVVPDDEVEERFKAAFQIYKHNKFKYTEEQEKLKIQNLEAKNLILEELKALISSEETLKKTYDEFKILQDRWKSIGMVPKTEVNNLWQNYHFLVEKFFDKVKINKELKDLDLRKNLEAKMELCEKAEELLLETSIIKTFKQLQQYHEDWKEIGPVPQDKKDELWERFRSATDQINERRREYYNEMQEGLEQNLAAKTILCEKAEQLIGVDNDSIKSWQDGTNQITELLQIWKSLGPAPKKQNNEIWARFKTSLDTFFNAKKDFYNKLKEQQMHNYNLKLDLCVQAEALRSSTDWRNTTRELINMQNEWKNIGPVPRKQSDKIWKRFRAACDEFFQTKSAYFKNVSGHEEENMKLKLDLIEKAKVFEIGENRNEAIETLKDFQRQFMEIGHVPIKEKERLQTEFRAVINKHFEKLKMESISMGATNYRSRVDRMAKDSPDAGRVISKERNYVQGKIQQLQDEIKTWENNIGFFAKSKTANLLKQEFEKKIDKAKEELQLLEAKLKMLRETNQ
ncbi:MAG: DUF349 domain-containing protein [Lentimicrobium sp.]|jgi:hypothetical protein|nr:DUF349 domain-containing protein [Lentimicrobium sp.]